MRSETNGYSGQNGRGGQRMSREEHEEQETDFEEIFGWLKHAFARIENSDEGQKSDGLPVKKIIVHLRQKLTSQSDRNDDVETYDFMPGDSVPALAQQIGERASQEAAVIGGGTYTISIDGFGSRWTISFDGATAREAREREGSGGASAMVQRTNGGGSYGNNGNWTSSGGGGGGGYPRPGFNEQKNPIEVVFQAMAHDKTVQLAHNERLLDLAINAQADTNRMVKTVMQEQHETIRTYEKERMKGFSVMEDLYSRKHERDLEFATRVKNEERKDKVFSMVEPLAHGVAARFLGARALPPEMSPVVQMLSSAFSGMTPERLHAIVSSDILNKEEVVALMEMFKVLNQFQEEAQKKAAAANGAGANGAATNGAAAK